MCHGQEEGLPPLTAQRIAENGSDVPCQDPASVNSLPRRRLVGRNDLVKGGGRRYGSGQISEVEGGIANRGRFEIGDQRQTAGTGHANQVEDVQISVQKGCSAGIQENLIGEVTEPLHLVDTL